MKTIKATHYSQAEGCKTYSMDFELTKNDLSNPHKYDFGFNHEYSEPLGKWVKGVVMFIKNIKCSTIYFEDGSIYSCNRREFVV